ncbi:MAG: hypothetical protein IJ374_07490 [Lachnospiraceae bacterium]|nr:hypothetical protein [Lachnospiraceae bacterium]
MRKQTKIAAVVSAAALLAIGASFTSMAAAKTGTWKNEDGTWYCYDKNGDVYENEFCLDGSKEFYVGDDGAVVYSSWVEHDGYMYYIQSDGSKAAGVWKWLTPYEDEDADEAWYWFTASGKRLDSDYVTYQGARYYFDSEGKNLTGWVDKDNYTEADEATPIEDLVYCGEDGARVVSDWVKVYQPGVNEEEDDLDDYSQAWYYLKSLGTPTTGKASNIDGETYFFTTAGKMLTGWIGYDESAGTYASVDGENAPALSTQSRDYDAFYFACTVDGHAKKNKWIKEWDTENWYDADPDVSKKWFWIEKDGKVFLPDVNTATASNAVDFEDGSLGVAAQAAATPSNVEFKTINNEIYAFDIDGEMISGLQMINGDVYYFGGSNDGARKTGAQTIADDSGESYKFYFGTEDDNGYKKGVGITGAKNGKLYEDGLLVTATDYKYEVVTVDTDLGTGKFIVNKSGSIQTSKKVYEDDGYFVICADDATGHNPDVKFNTTTGVLKGSVTGLACTKTAIDHE